VFLFKIDTMGFKPGAAPSERIQSRLLAQLSKGKWWVDDDGAGLIQGGAESPIALA
jgi:hypothetical protein